MRNASPLAPVHANHQRATGGRTRFCLILTLVFSLTLLAKIGSAAQKQAIGRPITGTVKDALGRPLSGVSVAWSQGTEK